MPAVEEAAHVAPQAIPLGVLETVLLALPLPVFWIVSV